jgi:hypothetical protein
MSKVFVCTRLNHHDMHLFQHFMEYYLKLGVDKVFFNFNYKIEQDTAEFESFLTAVKQSIYVDNFIFNLGPNGDSKVEQENLTMLYSLVDQFANLNEDFVIPADSDEFVEFPINLREMVKLMQESDYSCALGKTVERITSDGVIRPVTPEMNIFEQFPNNNPHLFVKPKVGIIKAKYYKYTGVGHHLLRIPEASLKSDEGILMKKIAPIETLTHHFRWNSQGQKRMNNWTNIWSNPNYKGWNGTEEYEVLLRAFNSNLQDFKRD